MEGSKTEAIDDQTSARAIQMTAFCLHHENAREGNNLGRMLELAKVQTQTQVIVNTKNDREISQRTDAVMNYVKEPGTGLVIVRAVTESTSLCSRHFKIFTSDPGHGVNTSILFVNRDLPTVN